MKNNIISKRLQELLKDATPKQKAILVALKGLDARTNDEEALVSPEEAEAIIDSLKTASEARTYNRWIRYYNVYADIAPLFGLAKAEYERVAQEVLGYLRQWETLQEEENNLNTILNELKEKAPKAVDAFRSSLSYCSFRYAKVETDSEGYVQIDTKDLYDIVKKKISSVYNFYSAYKTFIVAVEQWTAEHKCSAIMPPKIKEAIEEAKQDYALAIAPAYSRKSLNERKEKGERISLAEARKALFPYYEEIKIDEEYLEIWKAKLKGLEE